MPIFFLVGGYVNGLGWQSAQSRQEDYASWLTGRLHRLIVPVLPVLAVWTLFGLAAVFFDADRALLKIASQFALLPAWFLVVYILVVLLVPLSHRAWQRYGFHSFWALVAAAVLVDLLALGVGWRIIGWLNYLFVWLAIHQLGFAWQAGSIAAPRRCLLWAAGGLAALIALVALGPYPISMVSVRGDEISNSLPPTVTLLALGVCQSGLLLALEKPARRLLERGALWTATVLINGMIMTIFLWHVTALLLVSGLAVASGVGLSFFPGTADWWLTRPAVDCGDSRRPDPIRRPLHPFRANRHGAASRRAPGLAPATRLRPRLPRPRHPHPPRHPHRKLAWHQPSCLVAAICGRRPRFVRFGTRA